MSRRMYVFPIAIHTHGNNPRDLEREFTAYNVVEAVNYALAVFNLKDGEFLHTIHVGVPRRLIDKQRGTA